MKTRLGFVSNSSSSSFVLLGFAVPTEEIDGHEEELVIKLGLTTEEKLSKSKCPEDYIRDLLYNNVGFLDHGDGGAPKGTYLIGTVIADIHDDSCYSSKEIDLDELVKKTKSLQEKLNIKTPMKIYSGSRGY